MYRPPSVPLDLSRLPSYLQQELSNIAGELNGYQTKSFVPAWTAATTQPVLGNGSLLARYKLTNDLCEYWLRLTAGSTTTFGSGEWRFELPVRAKEILQIGVASFLDAGTNRFAGTCEAGTVDNFLRMYAHGSLNPVQSNVPHVWAQNDVLLAHVRYLR